MSFQIFSVMVVVVVSSLMVMVMMAIVMIHAALSGHHCTSVKEMSTMISCLFEKNGQFNLGATGSETLEEVYSNTSANIIYMVYGRVKIEGFSLSCWSEGKGG